MFVSTSERILFFFAIHTLMVIKLTHSHQFNTGVHFFHNAFTHRETSTTSATEGEIDVVTGHMKFLACGGKLLLLEIRGNTLLPIFSRFLHKTIVPLMRMRRRVYYIT